MADVIVSLAVGQPRSQRQDRLRPIHRLNPTLIDSEDHGLVGWIEIEPDDIARLFNKVRIFREFEARDAMGL